MWSKRREPVTSRSVEFKTVCFITTYFTILFYYHRMWRNLSGFINGRKTDLKDIAVGSLVPTTKKLYIGRGKKWYGGDKNDINLPYCHDNVSKLKLWGSLQTNLYNDEPCFTSYFTFIYFIDSRLHFFFI